MAVAFKDLVSLLLELPEEHYQEIFDKLTDIKHSISVNSQMTDEISLKPIGGENDKKYQASPQKNDLKSPTELFHEAFKGNQRLRAIWKRQGEFSAIRSEKNLIKNINLKTGLYAPF